MSGLLSKTLTNISLIIFTFSYTFYISVPLPQLLMGIIGNWIHHCIKEIVYSILYGHKEKGTFQL